MNRVLVTLMLAAVAALAACGQSATSTAVVPLEIERRRERHGGGRRAGLLGLLRFDDLAGEDEADARYAPFVQEGEAQPLPEELVDPEKQVIEHPDRDPEGTDHEQPGEEIPTEVSAE